MSADNWMVCPNCVRQDARDAELEKKELKKLYGKVSEQEYLNAKARAEYRSPIEAENLRENYTIGLNDDGKFIVYYKCSCDVCDFSYEYNFEKKVVRK